MMACVRYWRALGALTLVAVATLITGCAQLRSSQQAPAILLNNTAAAGDDLSVKPFDLTRDCMPSDYTSEKTSEGYSYKCSQPTLQLFNYSDTSEQILRRNRFQDYLLWMSEKACVVHKAGITSGQATTNFALNTITTGTSAVGALVLAPATNILAAIAAISSGTRGHFNEDIYQQYVGPIIIKQINSSRNNMLLEIMRKRVWAIDAAKPAQQAPTPKSLANYTVEEAIMDVERYHQLCSGAVALSALLNGNQTQFADTAAGISARISLLQQQQLANDAQIKALNANKPQPGDAGNLSWQSSMQRLQQTNDDIARQINILQQQMLTAPQTVSSGSK